jgi:hypothetical protein
VLAPGADPKVIRLAFAGGEGLRIDPNGDLILGVTGGEIRLLNPQVHQEIDGVKYTIPGRYVLLRPETTGAGLNQVGFEVAAYDTSKPLIIDPVLSYSTFIGGTNLELGNRIAVDSNHNVYVIGPSYSPNFPTTSGAYDKSFNGTIPDAFDTFVTKIDPSQPLAQQLIYSTYLGGSTGGAEGSEGWGIAVDCEGNAYVTGLTGDSDFPTTSGAYNESYNGGKHDVFVTKLNAVGSDLLYSTFIGDSATNQGFDIDVGYEGNAYVTGQNGTDGAFVTKLTADGSNLDYYITFGGQGRAITLDRTEHCLDSAEQYVYATGQTGSANDGSNIYVKKLNALDGSIVYSTAFGGGTDTVRDITVDNAGDVYVTGTTRSSEFPTTPGAYDESFNGFLDAFATRLDASGAVAYSTVLGGPGDDKGKGIVLDAAGNVWITGATSSSDFPTTVEAYDRSYNGGDFDAYVATLDATLSHLLYSSFFGGSGQEKGNAIARDSDSGDLYIVGETTSSDFPTTSGAYDESWNGDIDVFVMKLSSAECGNGVVASGEECDQGVANGTVGSCCSSTCQFVPSGTICRAAAGVCDVAESCTGTSASCPADAKSTAVCRAAVGPCDVAESCDGASNDCPANGFQPNGTACNDGNACTQSDTCQAGTCMAGATLTCNDDNACTTDSCDPGSGCVHTPDNSAYSFVGFYSPVDNPPTFNVGKAGRTYPLKWQTQRSCSAEFFCDTNTVASLQYHPISCDNSAPQDALTADTSGSSGLRCGDNNQYIYTWQTSSTFAGKCYEFLLSLNNGLQETAKFKFTK